MIAKTNYMKLKDEFGNVASWAIWEQPIGRLPKSNMRTVSMFDNEDILESLNPNYVFIGLNGSGVHDDYMDMSKPWHNFHSSNPRGHDYKLRYALMNTPYWGAYITDAIKGVPEVDSVKVSAYLRENPRIVIQSMELLRKEIQILGTKPILVCLGVKSYELVKKHLGVQFTVKKIMHYSYQIGKEDYRKHVLKTLSGENGSFCISLDPSLPNEPPAPKSQIELTNPNIRDKTDVKGSMPSLEECLKKSKLDMPKNWRGDIREQLLSLFESILKNTDFSIRKNLTDTTKAGLNLFYKDETRRCMGFGKMKDMYFKVYPTKPFYEEIRHKVKLPEADPKKSQVHMKMTLEEFWEFLYIITR